MESIAHICFQLSKVDQIFATNVNQTLIEAADEINTIIKVLTDSIKCLETGET